MITFNASAVEQQRLHDVVLIQSNSKLDSWSQFLEKGFYDGIHNNGFRVILHNEYLDIEHHNFTETKALMLQICERARKQHPSVLVVTGDAAYDALMQCGDSLPYQIPVVVMDIKFVQIDPRPNVCGFLDYTDYNQLMESAFRLFPKRTDVVFMYDNHPKSLQELSKIEAAFKTFRYTHPKYTASHLNIDEDSTLPITTICDVTAAQKKVVIVPRWSNYHSFYGKNSKAPIFTGQYSALGNGVLCVNANPPYQEAFEAGEIAARIINGEQPSAIGIKQLTNPLLYDYNQLDFFHINPDSIDKKREEIIINMPITTQYRLLFFILYVVTVVVLVGGLLWLNRMRRRERRRRNYAQTRLLIQTRLVEQRNEFDAVLNSMHDGIVSYDTNLQIRLMNHAFLSMLNMPEEFNVQDMEDHVAGTLLRIYVNGEDILEELLRNAVSKAERIAIPENAFIEVVKSGVHFPISGEVMPMIIKDKVSGIILCCRNISESELNKRMFHLALDTSAIFPSSYDIGTQTFAYSRSLFDKLGLDNYGTLSLEYIRSIIHPDDLPRMEKGFREVCTGIRSDYHDEMRARTAQGYEWVAFSCVAYKGFTANAPYKVLSVAQSIQKYKDIETELTTARDKALEADKLKSAFLANMSHEIRTPLNSIVGFSDLLHDIDAYNKEEIQDFVETINVNCTLLLALINDILDIARIEAGSMDFRFEHYELAPIMKEIYESQRYTMPAGVGLILDIPENSTLAIDTDVIRLKQVILNFINNAKKFTKNGNITFGYLEEPNYTSFFVEDTGIGLSEEDQRRIFERFYKVDSFTQGAGLGLSICQTITDRFKGTISVLSAPKKGTRFTVRVPNVQK
jgi:signal transduction histidine kinase/ABC-type uncharacterized transport system substrate-binding protein